MCSRNKRPSRPVMYVKLQKTNVRNVCSTQQMWIYLSCFLKIRRWFSSSRNLFPSAVSDFSSRYFGDVFLPEIVSATSLLGVEMEIILRWLGYHSSFSLGEGKKIRKKYYRQEVSSLWSLLHDTNQHIFIHYLLPWKQIFYGKQQCIFIRFIIEVTL